MVFLRKGISSNLPNSMQVIPKDQMSTFPSYWPSSMANITSGAILCKINMHMPLRKSEIMSKH